jgi:hypothetical protein
VSNSSHSPTPIQTSVVVECKIRRLIGAPTAAAAAATTTKSRADGPDVSVERGGERGVRLAAGELRPRCASRRIHRDAARSLSIYLSARPIPTRRCSSDRDANEPGGGGGDIVETRVPFLPDDTADVA